MVSIELIQPPGNYILNKLPMTVFAWSPGFTYLWCDTLVTLIYYDICWQSCFPWSCILLVYLIDDIYLWYDLPLVSGFWHAPLVPYLWHDPWCHTCDITSRWHILLTSPSCDIHGIMHCWCSPWWHTLLVWPAWHTFALQVAGWCVLGPRGTSYRGRGGWLLPWALQDSEDLQPEDEEAGRGTRGARARPQEAAQAPRAGRCTTGGTRARGDRPIGAHCVQQHTWAHARVQGRCCV